MNKHHIIINNSRRCGKTHLLRTLKALNAQINEIESDEPLVEIADVIKACNDAEKAEDMERYQEKLNEWINETFYDTIDTVDDSNLFNPNEL
jgi:predicted AAA+ superfamily ATPase